MPALTASRPEAFSGTMLAMPPLGLFGNSARGVFDGVGKIVELPPQPGDPENMDRDDLVFQQGTLHSGPAA